MPYGLKTRHLFVGLLGISTTLIYQNCAPNVETTSVSSYASSLPFAYNAQIDTIAYMSCSNMTDPTANPRAYFSLRASAYDKRTGGLMLTSEFINKTSHFTTQNRALALGQSDLNAGALLNLSIRSRGNAQSLLAVGKGARSGYEIDSFLPELDGPDVGGVLAGTGTPGSINFKTRVNYFPGLSDQRLMEASLRFGFEPDNVSSEVRNNVQGAGANPAYLVVGYSGAPDPTDTTLRMPPPAVAGATVPAKLAYGSGYQLSFTLPVGYSSGERRVISPVSGVQEVDMTTGQLSASSWDCGAGGNYQFEIIRPEDLLSGYVTGCNQTVDYPTTQTQLAALKAIRRVLRVEDWYVDVAHHCVIPKATGDYCYGQLPGTQRVQYGPPACPLSSSGNPNYTCPHFVSVCIRN